MDLVALIDRWRETRDPRLGALVVTHGARLAVDVGEPMAKLKPLAKGKALIDALGALRPETITPILATLDAFARTARGSWPVIEILAEQPADPRIAAFALALLRDFGTLPHISAKLWRRLVDTVETHGDTGIAAELPALVLPPNGGDGTKTRLANVTKRLAAGGAPIADAEVTAIARAMTTAGVGTVDEPATDGDALLAAIYADPGDLAARTVYADFLGATDDPRGEFITLQLQRLAGTITPAGEKRELALLRQHARVWLGSLAGLTVSRRPTPTFAPIPGELAVPKIAGAAFAGGFLVRAPALEVPAHRRGIYDDPIWATVHTAARVDGFSAAMRALRVVGTNTCALATLAELGHPLDLLDNSEPSVAHELADARTVLAIRSTAYDVASAWKQFHAVVDDNATITSIELRTRYVRNWHENDLARHLAPALAQLRTIRFVGSIVIELRRTSGGAWNDATIWVDTKDGASVFDVEGALAPFVAEPLARLRVVSATSLDVLANFFTRVAQEVVRED